MMKCPSSKTPSPPWKISLRRFTISSSQNCRAIAPIWPRSRFGKRPKPGASIRNNQENPMALDGDLLAAVNGGDAGKVKDLLKQNPKSANEYSADGWTALHLAAFLGHRQMAEVLLEMGAQLSALSKNQMANQPLHAAIAGKTDREMIQMLIERGADVNARGGAGVAPLHLAASRGDGVLCELLINRGANAEAKMDDGATPSDIASKRGHASVAEQIQ